MRMSRSRPPPTPVDIASENVPTTSALRLTACRAPESAPMTTAVSSTGTGTRSMATTCGARSCVPRQRDRRAPNQPRADGRGAGAARILAIGTMVHSLSWLSRQPFILLFLVVAGGIALGRVKIKGIGLGATASSLIIALAVSVLAAGHGAKIAVPELTGTIFFNMFMFSVGMKVGPQFLAGLKRDAG